jgi:hypothetical protein
MRHSDMKNYIVTKWQSLKQWLKAEFAKADEVNNDEDWIV